MRDAGAPREGHSPAALDPGEFEQLTRERRGFIAFRLVPGGMAELMAIELVFETHSITVDNEEGRATGWWPGRLSDQGRALAARLGERRRDDGIATVFSSDLARAAETASVAFGTSGIPVLLDWRLRECDYGKRNWMPGAELHAKRRGHLDRAYPRRESCRPAVAPS